MKRTLKILSFLFALLFAVTSFVACNGSSTGTTTTEGKDLVTVQWVQGQKVLKEETIERGSKVAEWTPVIEGMEFQGWYERPYVKKFDFDKKITKSVRIYAYFKSTGVEDPGEFEFDQVEPTAPTPVNPLAHMDKLDKLEEKTIIVIPGGGGGNGGNGGGGNTVIEIPDEDVPLTDMPGVDITVDDEELILGAEDEVAEEEGVVLGAEDTLIPKTGDNNHMTFGFGGMLAALAGMFMLRKKKEN